MTPEKAEKRQMTPEEKKWIDEATYEELLRKWRYAPVGDPLFQHGGAFDYYSKVMKEKRLADPAEHVRASKAIYCI